MSLPKPEPGLVFRYSYLWHSDHVRGLEEGTKDRPCAIILAVEEKTDAPKMRVLAVPIAHTAPRDVLSALEIPQAVKNRLSFNEERSWAVLTESNEFIWPGPDLRRVPGRDDGSVAYGFLPPKLFAEIKRKFIVLARAGRSVLIKRTE
ncbi:MAG: hypothetical protein ACLPWS_11475 [Rhodomicrobium sp.]